MQKPKKGGQKMNENSGPEALTVKAITEYLIKIGVPGVVDFYDLANTLGSISQRMLRNFSNTGELKAISRHPFIFERSAVVEFLLKHPRYLARKTQNIDVTEDVTNKIEIIIKTQWRGLLELVELEDLIATVQTKLLRTPVSRVPLSVIVNRILGMIYRKERKRINTIPLEDYHV